MDAINGLIKFYGLQDWWKSTFTQNERDYILNRYNPMGSSGNNLVEGQISSNQEISLFLFSLSTWFRKPEDQDIHQKIIQKIDEIARSNPVRKPGYYKGRHYVTFTGDVKNLKRKGDLESAENLLWQLIKATEAESKAESSGVAPWYYEELAKIYRKRKDYQSEVAILERYTNQPHAPGVKPAKLADRLNKAKQLLVASI